MSDDSLFLIECNAGAAAMPRNLLTAHGYSVHVVSAEGFAPDAAQSGARGILIATSGTDLGCARAVLESLGGRDARVPAFVINPGCALRQAAGLLQSGAADVIDEGVPGSGLLGSVATFAREPVLSRE